MGPCPRRGDGWWVGQAGPRSAIAEAVRARLADHCRCAISWLLWSLTAPWIAIPTQLRTHRTRYTYPPAAWHRAARPEFVESRVDRTAVVVASGKRSERGCSSMAEQQLPKLNTGV